MPASNCRKQAGWPCSDE